MVQVKCYGHKAALQGNREALSTAVQAALGTAFGVSQAQCVKRFIGLEEGDFVHPDERSEQYTIIEIVCFEGRSSETKRALIRLLYDEIVQRVGIEAADVEIILFEAPASQWGMNGRVAEESSHD